MRNRIRVEVVSLWRWKVITGQPVTTFRVYCVTCGHDDFRWTLGEAMTRALEMHRDHIPYDPNGELSCMDWSKA